MFTYDDNNVKWIEHKADKAECDFVIGIAKTGTILYQSDTIEFIIEWYKEFSKLHQADCRVCVYTKAVWEIWETL